MPKKSSKTPTIDLIPFLYLLMRDEITPGTVEQLITKIEFLKNEHDKVTYSNKFLADYAKSLAERLLDS